MGKFFQGMVRAAVVAALLSPSPASAVQATGERCNIPKLDKILAGHLTPT